MSSDKAHVQIYILGPFIPTIALQNSTLLLSKKKKGYFDITTITLLCSYAISVCVGVSLTTQKHAHDVSTSGTCLHLFFAALCSPCSTVWWRSKGGRFYGDLGGNSPACFSLPYIYGLKTSTVSLFAFSNLN